MHSNVRDKFIRQPHQFGSVLSCNVSEGNVSHKRLIISGNLINTQDAIKSLLNRLGYTNYKFIKSNGEDSYLITLSPHCDAKDALKNISENLKMDQIENLTVKHYEPKDERNVYIKNLPLQYTEIELFDLFQPYGSIISKKIIKKPANNNSIGFVRYTTKEEAEKAISEINNMRLNFLGNDRSVRCEFSKTSNPSSNTENRRTNNNFYSSTPVPRFQTNQAQDVSNISQYAPNNIYYNQFIDHQLASQYSNISISPQTLIYQGYRTINNNNNNNNINNNNTNNTPVLIPLLGNYQIPYPFMMYPPTNQNNYYQQYNS